MQEKEFYSEERPWGDFRQYVLNSECTVKILTVKDGEGLSLQSHKNRDELWVALNEFVEVELDDKTLNPKPYEEIFIPHGSKHRARGKGGDAKIMEISFGHFDEKDETRYEDKYGRIADCTKKNL